MKTCFTICSNNYLAQAKTLGDSLLKHNPDYQFIICLVDEYSEEIDYSFFQPHKIVLAKDIGIESFDDLCKKYDIVELNTSVKASFFKYIFSTYQNIEFTFYFDPDIMIFNSLNMLEKEFDSNDVLLTTHINTPIDFDEFRPNENVFLNYGIYNLGFLGLKRSDETFSLLEWWEVRLLNYGFSKVSKGFFVDQLWMNFAPLFFNKVKILKQYGYNCAPWNLHERKNIKCINNSYVMHDGSVLTFFHFSSYDYSQPNNISKYYTRYDFINCSDLVPLYKEYHENLISNNIAKFCLIKCYYASQYIKNVKPSIYSSFKSFLKLVLPPIIFLGVKKISSK